MQHAFDAYVIYIATIAKREFVSFVFDAARSNATNFWQHGRLTLGNHFNCIQNLDVSCAATKVRTKMARHIFALEVSAFLVHLSFRADNDSWNAESTLQSATRSKSIGVLFTL